MSINQAHISNAVALRWHQRPWRLHALHVHLACILFLVPQPAQHAALVPTCQHHGLLAYYAQQACHLQQVLEIAQA